MAVESTAGVRLTGELLSAATESGTLDNGKGWSKGVVKMLVGDFVERVSFPTLADADLALGGAERGQLVTLEVRPQGAFEEASGRRSKVTYRGNVAVGV